MVSVLGPGTALGEMSLMDGGVRSLTCTATATHAAPPDQTACCKPWRSEHPEVAAKLISIIFIGMSVRMRDLTEKLKRYVRLNKP